MTDTGTPTTGPRRRRMPDLSGLRNLRRGRGAGLGGSFRGAFAFVLIGSAVATEMSLTINGNVAQSGIAKLVISLGWGFALFTGIIITGPVGEVNSAATFGKAVRKRRYANGSERRDLGSLRHIAAQFLGALLASLLVSLWYGDAGDEVARYAAATPTPVVNYLITALVVIFVEALGTAWLMRTDIGNLIGGRLGLVVSALAGWFIMTALVMLALNVTGGAFNPARWFGPAVISWTFAFGWAYLAGQLLGGYFGVSREAEADNAVIPITTVR